VADETKFTCGPFFMSNIYFLFFFIKLQYK